MANADRVPARDSIQVSSRTLGEPENRKVFGCEPYDPGPMNTEPARAGLRVPGSRLSALRAPAGMTRHKNASPSPGSGGLDPAVPGALLTPPLTPRSEEHTSELQSLMRISYAVLCLQK